MVVHGEKVVIVGGGYQPKKSTINKADPPGREEVKKTISEWGKEIGVKIIDPAGFDRSDPELNKRKFTKEEFIDGMVSSTCWVRERNLFCLFCKEIVAKKIELEAYFMWIERVAKVLEGFFEMYGDRNSKNIKRKGIYNKGYQTRTLGTRDLEGKPYSSFK